MLFFRSKLFLKWVCVYALLLALPTLVTGIVSSRVTAAIVTEQAAQMNLASMSNASQVFDRIFHDVSTLSVLLEYLPWLRNIVELSENDIRRGERFGPGDILKIITVLRTYRVRYPALSEISVMIKNSDMAIDCEGKFGIDEYFATRYTLYSPSAGSITRIDWSDAADYLYPDARVRKYNEAITDRVLVVHKIPGGSPTPKAVVIFQLNKAYLAQTLERFRGTYHSSLAALSPAGELIQAVGDLAPALFLQVPGPDRGTTGSITLAKQRYAYTWTGAGGRGLRYLTVTAVAELSRVADRVRWTTFALAGCALAVGLLLAYATTRRNFLPIRSLAQQLAAPTPARGPLADELALIAGALAEMKAESSELHRRLHEFLPAARASLLNRLLAGTGGPGIDADLAVCGITLPGSRVTAAILVSELKEGERIPGELGRAGASAIIRERIQAFFAGIGETCYVVDHDPLEYRLVLSTNAGAEQDLRPLFQRLLASIERPGDGGLAARAVIAAGNLHEGAEGIAPALEEAKAALDHRPVSLSPEVLLYADLSESVRDELAFDAEARRRIVDALRSGEPGRVEELLDDVLSHRVMERRMGSWGVYALFELLVQALRSIPGADPHLVHSIDLNRLAALPDDGERIRYCRSTFARIAAAVARRHRGDDVAAGIVEFVDANYADPAMSLTLLSDRFRLSPIYISRLFKQKAGDNFLDYLNRRRVQRAKELLSAPRALVKGVGRTAGFASEVSFRRVFRKYEATSPAEFRRRADAAGAHAAPGA